MKLIRSVCNFAKNINERVLPSSSSACAVSSVPSSRPCWHLHQMTTNCCWKMNPTSCDDASPSRVQMELETFLSETVNHNSMRTSLGSKLCYLTQSWQKVYDHCKKNSQGQGRVTPNPNPNPNPSPDPLQYLTYRGPSVCWTPPITPTHRLFSST